ncbi:MAG: hypothetical protein JWR66_1445, partial [Modestobacter sp.]|nr:hypothetical protein [Modestobacter sp.]
MSVSFCDDRCPRPEGWSGRAQQTARHDIPGYETHSGARPGPGRAPLCVLAPSGVPEPQLAPQ